MLWSSTRVAVNAVLFLRGCALCRLVFNVGLREQCARAVCESSQCARAVRGMFCDFLRGVRRGVLLPFL